MTAGRTAAQITGAVIAAIAAIIIVAGVVAVAIAGTNGGSDGYLNTPTYHMETDGHAVTFGAADVQTAVDGWVPWQGLFNARITAEADSSRVFVGVGPANEVAAYLDDVQHTRVTDMGVLPSHLETEDESGSTAPGRPAAQGFWVAQKAGEGVQTLDWAPTDGSWTVVVMNADGSAGVDVAAGGGVSIGVLWPVGLALVVAGVLGLLVAIVLLVIGSSRRRTAPRPAGPAGPAVAPTP